MQSIIDAGGNSGPMKRQLRYAGRPLAASPAAGAHKVHHDQQEGLVEEAFSATVASTGTYPRIIF